MATEITPGDARNYAASNTNSIQNNQGSEAALRNQVVAEKISGFSNFRVSEKYFM
jgi:hypothetical protein